MSMKPDAWIKYTRFGNKLLAFKKPEDTPPCYTGVELKEYTELLYSAATIRKWLEEEPSEEMLDAAARESYAVNCHTNGPRFLAKYASDEIMRAEMERAKPVIIGFLAAKLKALEVAG